MDCDVGYNYTMPQFVHLYNEINDRPDLTGTLKKLQDGTIKKKKRYQGVPGTLKAAETFGILTAALVN